jgi:hypothetical protein
MADRTMQKGDTWPPLKGEAKDETGVLDLSGAAALELTVKSAGYLLTATPVAIWPAEADADGIHHWNWEYDFQEGDTDETGDYKVQLKVTWEPGHIERFPNSGAPVLTIEDAEA